MINARVKFIKDEEVEGEIKELFQRMKDTRGEVPKFMRAMANRPEILSLFAKLLATTMGPGLVEQDNKWKMAYRISKLNKCLFCIGVVENQLKKLGVGEDDMAKVINEEDSKMKPDEKIAVKYAEVATKNATKVDDELFEKLRRHYNDAQIVELTAVIGLFNYMNRFNDALQIVPEP